MLGVPQDSGLDKLRYNYDEMVKRHEGAVRSLLGHVPCDRCRVRGGRFINMFIAAGSSGASTGNFKYDQGIKEHTVI